MDKNFFKEQLVKKQVTAKDMMIKTSIIVGGIILSLLAFMFLGGLAVIAVCGICFGGWYVLQRTNKEFEYIFTNGDLDIDTIFNKVRRKRSFSVNVRELEIMAKVNDTNYANELKNYDQVLDFSSGTNLDNTYAAILTFDGKKTKILIEPNEKILEAIKFYIPRKLKWKKYGN